MTQSHSDEFMIAYTRAQALEDGVLIDLSEWASSRTGFVGGFKIPVAVTAAVWSDVESIPSRDQGCQDVRGRAHDVLCIASLAARQNPNANAVTFRVLLSVGDKSEVIYRLVIGPGDHGEPVATIMQLGED